MAVNITSAFGNGGVGTPDIVIIIVYILLCLAVGMWATFRTQRGSISGYFLAERDMLWFAVGASLFASNIGSGNFVGLAGTGAASGIAVVGFELHGLYAMLLLAWLFVPVYIASGVYTLPEYLKKRFGGQRLQVYMSVLALLICVFTKISADIYAGAIFIQQSVGWNMYIGIVALLIVTAIYTVSGGLKAVIYTDTLQTVIMVAGAVVLMALSFSKVGGMNKLYVDYPMAIPSPLVNGSDCGHPTEEAFHLLRNPSTSEMPWPGTVFGIPILSTWYCCADQVIVQRSLAAKNLHHAKGGSILAAYLKILPFFTTVFPGMISRVLFTDQVACVDPEICQAVCENPAGCTNIAYPKLVIELMPIGLKGLMLAAMMAALMSSLTSVFNSSSTIFTMDIWKRLRSGASDAELLVVGRIFVLVLVGISVVWIPVLQASQGGQLFNYIQSVTGYLAPPVLSVFLLAILWGRINEKGAFWGLMIGLIVGAIRMGLDFGYGSPGCGEEDSRPIIISKVHFLHFTIILFVISIFTTVVVSLATKPIEEKHLVRLTWWTRHCHEERMPFEEEQLLKIKAEKRMMIRARKRLDPSPTQTPRWKRFLYIICGYERPVESPNTKLSKEQNLRKLLLSIQEKPKWNLFLNVNVTILMVSVMFLWGFYA